MNTLAIGDLHLPFTHKKALDFTKKLRDKYKCERIVFMGDVVDLNTCSFHELSPDGLSSNDEIKRTRDALQPWIREYPSAYICIGNHDARPFRKASAAGISSTFIKSYGDIWGTPKEWKWDWSFEFDRVIYKHGSRSGIYAYNDMARDNRKNTVTGHIHASAGIHYMSSDHDLIWGMGVGCLINIKEYAFHYAKDYPRRPILGSGVVLDNGRLPIFEAMKLS
jgi:predicted phosphodiesterase